MVSGPLPAKGEKLNGKAKLRLWIRLLRASRIIEANVRERFKTEFDVTLPRFDVMAALYREPEGMLMSEISRFLMVSNGNITGIVDRLVSDKLAERSLRDGDRRTSIIKLTKKGKALFDQMARAHQGWIDEMLAGVSLKDANELSGKLKSFRSDWEGEL